MLWKMIIRILHCSKKSYTRLIRSGNEVYVVDIEKYVPASDQIKSALEKIKGTE